MATSGRFDISTNNSAIDGYVYWEEQNPSEITNGSDILMVAYLHRNNNYTGPATSTSGRTYTRTFFCSGKDNIVVGGTPSITIPNNKSYVEIGRATFTDVTHNSDGSLSVTLGFQASHQSGNNSFTIQKQEGNATLSTIARASEPTCGNVTLGSSVTINTNRKSSSFTHTIKISLNGNTIETFTGIGSSKSWNPSIATYAPYITNTSSATASIAVTTYNGISNIGTKYCTTTLTVPSTIKPTAHVSIQEGNSFLKSLNWGVFVQGKSKFQVSVSGSPAYGSAIKSYSTNIEGITYSSNSFLSNTITWTGRGNVKSIVTDYRNAKSNETTTEYVCLPYTKPIINIANVVRCDVTGNENEEGTYLKCAFSGSISSVNGKNSATFKIGYKKKNDSNFIYIDLATNSKTITSVDKTGNNSIVIGNGTIEVTSTYIVIFIAQDVFEPITIEKEVGTGFDLMNFHRSGKAMAIGKTSEADENEELLEIGIPTEYMGMPLLSYDNVDENESIKLKKCIDTSGIIHKNKKLNEILNNPIKFKDVNNLSLKAGETYALDLPEKLICVEAFLQSNGSRYSGGNYLVRDSSYTYFRNTSIKNGDFDGVYIRIDNKDNVQISTYCHCGADVTAFRIWYFDF